MEPQRPEVDVQSLNHWTPRNPSQSLLIAYFVYSSVPSTILSLCSSPNPDLPLPQPFPHLVIIFVLYIYELASVW